MIIYYFDLIVLNKDKLISRQFEFGMRTHTGMKERLLKQNCLLTITE